MRFGLNGGAFSHSADVRRLKGSAGPDDDAEDDAGRPFYVADMGADGAGAGGSVSARIPRAGTVRGSAQNGVMQPEGRWPAGRRTARGVPGAERCRRR
jgi:hypothetical protein